MDDRIREAVEGVLSDAPLTRQNLKLMIVLAVDEALRAHFEKRSERVWLWVQRLGWIAAILVAVSSWVSQFLS